MKLLIMLALSCFLSKAAYLQTIYAFSITTIEGQQHSLQEYNGKKILIVVLPSTQAAEDSVFLKRVDSIALAHTGNLQLIGVLSYEDGYNDDLLTTLQPFYRTFLDTTVMITQSMYTHKASGSQNVLFSWLTHTAQNTHYDTDVTGTGEMFFINEQGALYGVFGPEAKYSNKILNYMLH